MAPPLYGGGYARCMSVARRSTSYAMSCPSTMEGRVEWHRPCMGRSCPDVCPWRVVLHLRDVGVLPPMEDALNGTTPVWGGHARM